MAHNNDRYFTLLRNDITVHDDDIDTAFFFLKDHYVKVFSTLLSMLPKVGKDLGDFLDKIVELKKKFDDHNKEVNANVNEADTLLQFFSSSLERVFDVSESQHVPSTLPK